MRLGRLSLIGLSLLVAGSTLRADAAGFEGAFQLPPPARVASIDQPAPAGAEVSIPVPGVLWPGVVTLAGIAASRAFRRRSAR